MVIAHISCGADGCGHLAVVNIGHEREIVGREFALCGRTIEAEHALEEACIQRFGSLRVPACAPIVPRDNGLILQVDMRLDKP